jgi:ATP-dependent helicase HrpA
VTYFGFELERERESIDEFPPGSRPTRARVLAEALARGEARHPAVPRNRPLIDEVREVWRRSAGTTPRSGSPSSRRGTSSSSRTCRSRRSSARRTAVRSPTRWCRRPSVRAGWRCRERRRSFGRTVPMHYEVEEDATTGALTGVVRLQLPEKLARTLVSEELPALDRPVRFAVSRGARGAVKADTLEEMQELLDRPFSPGEPEGNRVGRARGRSAATNVTSAGKGPTAANRARTRGVRRGDGGGTDQRRPYAR